jgi:hypothetical protein
VAEICQFDVYGVEPVSELPPDIPRQILALSNKILNSLHPPPTPGSQENLEEY